MALPATPYTIPQNGLLKFRLFYFVRKYGRDVMFHIFSSCFRDDPSKSALQILEENGIPLGRRSPFNRQEIDSLTNLPLETLDISLLNKICQSLWEKSVNDPGDKIKELMKQIKNERNSVSHEEKDVSQDVLELRLQEFQLVLEDIIDEASSLYPLHKLKFSELKRTIKEAVPQIQEKIRESYDPLNPVDTMRLQAEIETFADQLRDYVREKSVKQLSDLYSDLCKVLPFDWLCQYGLVEPGSIMVSLKMDTDEEFHGLHTSHNAVILDQSEILDKMDPRGNDPKVIIISGNAGSGKTTLLCWLMEKWHKKAIHDIPSLSSYQILLYMEFRKHDHDNFDDYLRDMFQHLVSEIGFNQVKSSILQSKCLILCDGYDERNKSSSKLFEEILGLKCTAIKIIVSTRPIKAKELTETVNQSKRVRLNLTILGLRDREMKNLVEKIAEYLIADKNHRTKRIQEITQAFNSMTTDMKDVIRNPLYFSSFILLYNEYPDQGRSLNTMTKLFIELDKHNSKRLMGKLEIQNEEAICKFKKLHRRWSLKYYLQKKYELKLQEVDVFRESCQELRLDFDTVMSACFNIKHSRKGLDIVKIYCYRHRTEQEFAAAGAICDGIIDFYDEHRTEFDNLKKNKKNIVSLTLEQFKEEIGISEKLKVKTRRVRSLELDNYGVNPPEILRYITGILYANETHLLYLVIEDILKTLCKEHHKLGLEVDVDMLLHHLTETNNDEIVCDAIVKMIGRIDDLCIQKGESLSCIPSVVAKLKPTLLSVNLHKDNPNELTQLVPVLKNAVQNDVKLILTYHANNVISDGKYETNHGYTDTHLAAARTCITFEGYLSKTGIDLIPECIQNLNISLNFNDIADLSKNLPTLPTLEYLDLRLQLDRTINPDRLSPIPYKNNNFTVTLFTNLDLARHDNIQYVAKVLKAFWPTDRTRRGDDTVLDLYNVRGYSGEAVELLLHCLEIQPLSELWIRNINEDTKARKDEFKTLCETRRLGYLTLLRDVSGVRDSPD